MPQLYCSTPYETLWPPLRYYLQLQDCTLLTVRLYNCTAARLMKHYGRCYGITYDYRTAVLLHLLTIVQPCRSVTSQYYRPQRYNCTVVLLTDFMTVQ